MKHPEWLVPEWPVPGIGALMTTRHGGASAAPFDSLNLKPGIAWSHDVDGYSPGPGGNFEEGRKAVSLGLDAEYQNTYTASLSYTDFFGGDFNTSIDRDFLAFSVGVNF